MTIPEYTECENCYAIVPDGGHVHEAKRKEFNSAMGNYYNTVTRLCCECIVVVGGQCDE